MSNEIDKANGNAVSAALPQWLVSIRQAVTGAIKAEDLEAIFAKQVELAKGGDRAAAKFVFDQAKAFSEIKGLSVTQNNYYGSKPADRDPMPAEMPRPTYAPSRKAM